MCTGWLGICFCPGETSLGNPAASANKVNHTSGYFDIEIGSHLVAQDDLELTVAQAGLELV